MGVLIEEMKPSEISRIGEIDRSEHITRDYAYRDGHLESQAIDCRVPRWSTDETSAHSVQSMVKQFAPILAAGGVLLGALDGGRLVGLAILRYELTETSAQLAALYVSSGYRRRGIARRLTAEVIRRARAAGAAELYVSATPSESAVGFYRSQGFGLAESVHPELFALEPEDIHMTLRLSP
jgi:ribosomal protein S18 acetylase RimI-like enzyme